MKHKEINLETAYEDFSKLRTPLLPTNIQGEKFSHSLFLSRIKKNNKNIETETNSNWEKLFIKEIEAINEENKILTKPLDTKTATKEEIKIKKQASWVVVRKGVSGNIEMFNTLTHETMDYEYFRLSNGCDKTELIEKQEPYNTYGFVNPNNLNSLRTLAQHRQLNIYTEMKMNCFPKEDDQYIKNSITNYAWKKANFYKYMQHLFTDPIQRIILANILKNDLNRRHWGNRCIFVLYGVANSGKTLFARIMSTYISREYTAKLSPDDLNSQFSDGLRNPKLITSDEIVINNRTNEKLKSMADGGLVELNVKGGRRTLELSAPIITTTNSTSPVYTNTDDGFDKYMFVHCTNRIDEAGIEYDLEKFAASDDEVRIIFNEWIEEHTTIHTNVPITGRSSLLVSNINKSEVSKDNDPINEIKQDNEFWEIMKEAVKPHWKDPNRIGKGEPDMYKLSYQTLLNSIKDYSKENSLSLLFEDKAGKDKTRTIMKRFKNLGVETRKLGTPLINYFTHTTIEGLMKGLRYTGIRANISGLPDFISEEHFEKVSKKIELPAKEVETNNDDVILFIPPYEPKKDILKYSKNEDGSFNHLPFTKQILYMEDQNVDLFGQGPGIGPNGEPLTPAFFDMKENELPPKELTANEKQIWIDNYFFKLEKEGKLKSF